MIEIKNLTRRFDEISGIFDINFNINEGDVIAFVGDNGAGKTTTIKAIFGQIRLDKGEVLYNGQSIFDNRNLINLAFFPDSNLIPLKMTLKNYIKLTRQLFNLGNVSDLVDKLLKQFKLESSLNKKLKNLSSGEKKKAIMLTVLIRKPKFILFDEPTANLDVKTREEFLEILSILKSNGVSLFITSHLIDDMQKIVNKLMLIDEGRIIYSKDFDGDKENILDIYKKYTKEQRNNNKEVLNEIYS